GFYSLENKISSNSANLGAGLNDILTMENDGKDNFWIGGANSGLNYYDANKNKIISYNGDKRSAKGLPTSSVRSVYKDDIGLVWVGTYNKGVYLIDNNAGKFDSYQLGDFQQSELEGKDVTAFVEDINGDVWIAYNGIGLVLLEKKTNS